MSDPTLPPEEILDRYLNGNPNPPQPPADEAALANALRAAAAAAQPDPRFAAQLEARLKQSIAPTRGPSLFNFLWSPTVKRFSAFTLVTVLILVLLLGGAWLLKPQPQPALPDTEAPTSTPPATAAQTDGTSDATVSVTEAATVSAATATLIPATEAPLVPPQFAAGVTFPTAPATANLYTQALQPLTADAAKQMAQQIGVNGILYTSQGESNDPVYIVTDGQARVTFVALPTNLYFVVNYPLTLDDHGQPLPNDQRQTIAAEFLKAHNLLPAAYQAEPNLNNPNSFDFYPVMDGLRVTQGTNPLITVSVTATGQVRSVSYQGPQLTPLGTLPIISAEAAWQKANDSSGRGVLASSYYVAPPTVPYQAWARQYQPNAAVDMAGYLEVLKSVDPNDPPFLDLNNWPLNGKVQGLAAHGSGPIHVLGHITADDAGRLWLTVDQWQAVSQTDFNLIGHIERQGTDAFLVTSDSRYRLPDLPDDVPANVDVNISGAVVPGTDPRLEWWVVNMGEGGGGGGGGGGGIGFLEISLTPVAQATVQPTPFAPYQIGDPIADVHGELGVTRQQNTDGSLETHYTISIYSATSGYMLNLLGDKLAGTEAYNYLPVRVWGTITAIHPESYSLDVQVDKIEPVYPDLKIQAWIGNDAVATVSDKKVDLISSADGQKFVVDFTVNPPAGYEPGPMGSPDLKTIYEGYIVPDQTFGGYPLVHIFSTASGNDLDLSTYQLRSSQIPVNNPPGTGAVPSTLTIEKIDLVYLAQDFSHGSPQPAADCTCRTVQPIWRFIGHTADGQGYEIEVQAVTDDYLK